MMAVNDVQSRWHDTRKSIRLHETKIRFLFAGALNTVFGLAAYPTLYFVLAPLKLHYLVVLGITQVSCVAFSYLTNKFLVFRTVGNYLRESAKFALFHLSYFLVNLLALPFLVEIVGMSPVWGQTLFAVAVIITSYFWHSNITFSRPRTEKK
jgi:putative flippase GtrA